MREAYDMDRSELISELVTLFERDESVDLDDAGDVQPAVYTTQNLATEAGVSIEEVHSPLRFLLSQGRIVRTVAVGGAMSGFTRVAADETPRDALTRMNRQLLAAKRQSEVA